MIRKLQKADINSVADIWLDTNLKAHKFIPAQYWKNNFELVKELLSQAEVYVYESDQEIQGFIGLNGKYIEGIFVSDKLQSQGIGKNSERANPLLPYTIRLRTLNLLLFPSTNPELTERDIAFLTGVISLFIPLQNDSILLSLYFSKYLSSFVSSLPNSNA